MNLKVTIWTQNVSVFSGAFYVIILLIKYEAISYWKTYKREVPSFWTLFKNARSKEIIIYFNQTIDLLLFIPVFRTLFIFHFYIVFSTFIHLYYIIIVYRPVVASVYKAKFYCKYFLIYVVLRSYFSFVSFFNY